MGASFLGRRPLGVAKADGWVLRGGLGRREREALEAKFIRDGLACPPDRRGELTARCFAEAEDFEKRLAEEALAQAPDRYPSLLYGSAWRSFDRRARMPES